MDRDGDKCSAASFVERQHLAVQSFVLAVSSSYPYVLDRAAVSVSRFYQVGPNNFSAPTCMCDAGIVRRQKMTPVYAQRPGTTTNAFVGQFFERLGCSVQQWGNKRESSVLPIPECIIPYIS